MIRLTPGRCLVCGCSDRWGCASSCHWVDDWHTLCSRCARNMAALALALRIKQEGTPHAS
jgi:hypothetical protein